MGLYHYALNLVDHEGNQITTAGGKVYVATASAAAKATLYTAAGAALANPITPTNGRIEFWTATTVSSVDLYGMAPGGQFFVAKGVKPSGNNEIVVDTSDKVQVAVIPFAIADTTATTETDTGFDIPTNAAVLPHGVGVDVLTLDATETIDIGLLSTESGGDADGFGVTVSVATAVKQVAQTVVTTGVIASTTAGALICDYIVGTNADDRGISHYKAHVCDGTAKSISYTLTAGTDTAAGFITIPYQLSNL